ncbi:hypothetical protein KIPB_012298, partial [Kipferlia bialata]|eukprot:g12298.t1
MTDCIDPDAGMFQWMLEQSPWPFVHFCYNFFPAMLFQDAPIVLLGAYMWETFEQFTMGFMKYYCGFSSVELET